MSRYCAEKNVGPILEAADHWRRVALEDDGSVLTDSLLWTLENLRALERYYVNNLNFGEGNFLGKLEGQLEPAGPAAQQLAAEITWVMLLCPSNLTARNKRESIETIWSWSGEPLPESRWLRDDVLSGAGSAGTAYNTNRWRELVFAVRFLLAFKGLPQSERTALLADGWAFAQWLEQIPEADVRQLRHMVLFLLFPDQFERIYGGIDRRAIVAAFTGQSTTRLRDKSGLEMDRELAAIREAQAKKLGRVELDFYQEPLLGQWRVMELDDLDRDDVLAAIADIDRDGVPSTAGSTFYDLIYKGKRYPPKYVLALAHKNASGQERDRSTFAGGEESEAFSVLRGLGFFIERKTFIQTLLTRFFAQAQQENALVVSDYPRTYCGLELTVSFGKGTAARVPWIAFLGANQSARQGIFPVFLFYKSQKQLLLAYGISETEAPEKNWLGVEDKPTINAFYQEQGKVPDRYGESRVAAAYDTPQGLDYDKINTDLDRVIAQYQEQIGGGVPVKASFWIFQANPKLYDIDGAVQALTTLQWSVRQHAKKIRTGDKVFIWRAGSAAGIVAEATITAGPAKMQPASEEEPYRKAPFEDDLYVNCRIDQVIEEPLGADRIRANPDLAGLSILRFHQGTNFPVSAEQGAELQRMIRRGPEPPPPPPPPVYTAADFARETGFPPTTISQWLARLERKKQIIFQGPPGTGKTFIAERLARTLVSGTAGRIDVVQFHPSYAYEDFMQGIRPEVVDGQLSFHLSAGRFLEFCREAGSCDPQVPCVLIIDELNRANLSRVFGELMYLLEYRDKSVPLAAGGDAFHVPPNVYIIGTMNTADRSIALVDHALRRRFSFIYLGPEYDILQAYLESNGLPAESLVRALREVNLAIGDRHYEVGISFFMADGQKLKSTLPAIWTGEIEPYLEEFFYDQPGKVDALRWATLRTGMLAEWSA